MKKLIFVFIFLQFNFASGQTDAEVRILNELNLYRSKLGLPKVIYSAKLSNAARYQTKYYSMCKPADFIRTQHDQIFDFQDWEELSFSERCSKMWAEARIDIVGEVASNGGWDDEKMIIQGFDESPAHRQIMRTRGEGQLLVGISNFQGYTVIDFGN